MARPKTLIDQISPESAAHNKGRMEKRLRSPKPRGKLGPASKWLTEDEKKIWRKLVKSSPAVLGESDRCLLEIAVTLKAKLETHTIENAQITQLVTCLNKLGMIPADRAAVEQPAPKQDEWSEFSDEEPKPSA